MEVQETRVQTDRVLTVPNVLSVLRLLGIPVFLWLVLGPEADGWAVLLLMASGLTDPDISLAGALALGFASGAYQSEIFRGALLAVPPGQMKAARAIGLSRLKAIRFIIMPQALRLAIPAWSNEATLVLKDSTLVYVIGVPEILRQAQYVSARTLQPFLAYAAAAAIYVGMTFLVIRVLHAVERRHRLLL